jgi:hypothetical protein
MSVNIANKIEWAIDNTAALKGCAAVPQHHKKEYYNEFNRFRMESVF